LVNTEFGLRELSSAQAPVAAASVDQATDTLVQTTLMRSVPSGFTTRHPIGTTEATNKPEALPFFPGNAVADARGRPDGPLDHGRSMEISDRERQILDCLVAGHSNKAIARLLNIAEATVKVHIKALLRKMHVSNRTQAAISALHQRDRLKMQATNLVDFVAAKQILEKMSATEENTRPAAEAVCPM
jgi:DNA-binding NarL/FixJ family response regulator